MSTSRMHAARHDTAPSSTATMNYLGRPIVRPPPSATTTNRMKSQPEHIRRPRNSFIIFRSWMIYFDLVPKEFTATQQTRSEYVAKHWASLALAKNADVKRAFERLAEEEKMEHAINHPGYKYAPGTGKAADVSALSSAAVSSGRVASLRTRSSVVSHPPALVVASSHVTPTARRSDRNARMEPISTLERHDNVHGGEGQDSLYSLFPGTFASLPKSDRRPAFEPPQLTYNTANEKSSGLSTTSVSTSIRSEVHDTYPAPDPRLRQPSLASGSSAFLYSKPNSLNPGAGYGGFQGADSNFAHQINEMYDTQPWSDDFMGEIEDMDEEELNDMMRRFIVDCD